MRLLQTIFSTDAILSAAALVSLTTQGCVFVDTQIGQLDDTGTELGSHTGTDTDTDTGESEDSGGSPECTMIEEELAALFDVEGKACAMVIRSDFETSAVLGWSVECRDAGPDLSMDEAVELSTWGGIDLGVSGGDYVFFASPGDFGGLAFVGKKTGLVFEGSIIWDGAPGEITVPADTMNDPESLGLGCYEDELFGVEYWPTDVTNDEDVHLLPAEGEAALSVLIDSALFPALMQFQTRTSVLVYPRTVGAFDPSTAEIITIIDQA